MNPRGRRRKAMIGAYIDDNSVLNYANYGSAQFEALMKTALYGGKSNQSVYKMWTQEESLLLADADDVYDLFTNGETTDIGTARYHYWLDNSTTESLKTNGCVYDLSSPKAYFMDTNCYPSASNYDFKIMATEASFLTFTGSTNVGKLDYTVRYQILGSPYSSLKVDYTANTPSSGVFTIASGSSGTLGDLFALTESSGQVFTYGLTETSGSATGSWWYYSASFTPTEIASNIVGAINSSSYWYASASAGAITIYDYINRGTDGNSASMSFAAGTASWFTSSSFTGSVAATEYASSAINATGSSHTITSGSLYCYQLPYRLRYVPVSGSLEDTDLNKGFMMEWNIT
ncbi:hypothetical protein M0R19_03120 [Candidatus Pacearchaeota archaeon]|jgi:hypothetical protein|nr:hypothetical protein [Candidatus Pacearchaeota archaeon]